VSVNGKTKSLGPRTWHFIGTSASGELETEVRFFAWIANMAKFAVFEILRSTRSPSREQWRPALRQIDGSPSEKGATRVGRRTGWSDSTRGSPARSTRWP